MEWKDESTKAPQSGDVLVASPMMPDNPFSQTLVYLHDFDAEGSLGWILNRPTGKTLGGILPETDLDPELAALELYFGGPVQADQFLLTLFRLHRPTHRFFAEFNPDGDALMEALQDPNCVVRAFVGHSGWTAGQLESEINGSDWFWTAPDDVMLGPPAPNLWSLLVQGDSRWQAMRDLLPENPGLN